MCSLAEGVGLSGSTRTVEFFVAETVGECLTSLVVLVNTLLRSLILSDTTSLRSLMLSDNPLLMSLILSLISFVSG